MKNSIKLGNKLVKIVCSKLTTEENIEMDYRVADWLNITIDEVDSIPINILNKLRIKMYKSIYREN